MKMRQSASIAAVAADEIEASHISVNKLTERVERGGCRGVGEACEHKFIKLISSE